MEYNLRTFSFGRKTASAGTAFALGIWPSIGPGGGFGVLPGSANKPTGIARVTDMIYRLGTTGHTLTFMRPLNYTTFSADAAASQAVVNVTADPGSYSTAYAYGLPNGASPRTSNNAIAANDYVVYQAADGTWVLDTVSSVSSLAVTLTTNLPTGGVKAGGLLYFFGISTDTDPATAQAHPQMFVEPAASGEAYRSYTNKLGLWTGLHHGDPLVIYSNNATAQGYLEMVAGYYGGY